jgi:hypothetical protein
MEMERVCLGWDRPPLASAAEYLVACCSGADAIDLSDFVVVLPGSRAGHRLLEILIDRAEATNRPLVPPQIITPNLLPEGRLYQPKKPFADDLTQQLAWVKALRETKPASLQALIREPPAENDVLAWMSLGRLLAELHTVLAADRHDFTTVLEHARCITTFTESKRWHTLADVQHRYLQILDALELWDQQTARLEAIRRKECRAKHRIILAGMVDLNWTQRAMLDQVAGQVTVLLFAPRSIIDHFDRHGCVIEKSWHDASIPIDSDWLELVDGPNDQADAVVYALAEFADRYSVEEVTIGVPDASLAAFVMQRLEECGLPARNVAGKPMAQTDPYRLLEGIAACLDGDQLSAFETLVRHPGVCTWLESAGIPSNWLATLDEYAARRLPAGWKELGTEAPVTDTVAQLRREVARLLGGLIGPARPLTQWAQPIADTLAAVYHAAPLDASRLSDRIARDTMAVIANSLRAISAVPDGLMPTVSSVEAIRLVLAGCASERVVAQADRAAIELLGWLELPMDDAPALVLTGVCDGIVPQARTSDPFLPDTLRQRLGLESNRRRYARDACVLSLICRTRRDLRLIVGRRNADGDPLTPSRLLFACDDATLVQRAHRFFAPDRPPSRPMVLPAASNHGSASRFEIPYPEPLAEPVTSMKVTEFRDFLECPYRYYLKHQLGLTSVDTSQRELDGLAFGSLLHRILKRFADSPEVGATDEQAVKRRLVELLHETVRGQYGTNLLPGVRLQVELARRRLEAFAQWQAQRVRDGWRIVRSEVDVAGEQAPFDVDGAPMFLRGRIDRIDVHESTGAAAVLDYKTGDASKSPEKSHRKSDGAWTDLQLPLYRRLTRALGFADPLQLGYVVLPRQVEETGLKLAEWTAADLESAEARAAEVVRAVRRGHVDAGVFWPPAVFDERFRDDFADLCLVGVRTIRPKTFVEED